MTWDIYRLSSNPTRRRILLSLLQGDKAFSDLMRSVSMDPEHETGPFLYHVHRLEGVGLLQTLDGRYYLTHLGREVADDLVLVRNVLENRLGPSRNDDSGRKLELTSQPDKSRHGGGGILMSESEKSSRVLTDESKIIVRPLGMNDVDYVLEVLYHQAFYRKQPDHIRGHLEKIAARGLDRNENNFVAEIDDRAVARMVVDTNYPPYAELAGLVVHPNYQRCGVGKSLVSRFLEFTAGRSAPIQYVMVLRDDEIAQGLYRNFRFIPGILDGFHEKNREVCMFRFAEGSLPCDFQQRHPMAQPKTVTNTSGELSIGRMDWTDPLSESRLLVDTKGKRHLSMPRICRTHLQENDLSVDIEVKEDNKAIGPDHEGVFRIHAKNRGNSPIELVLRLLLPEGISVAGDDMPNHLNLNGMSEQETRLRIRMDPDFDVPALSFTTILVTCMIEPRDLPVLISPILVSAGFEDVRYSKGEC